MSLSVIIPAEYDSSTRRLVSDPVRIVQGRFAAGYVEFFDLLLLEGTESGYVLLEGDQIDAVGTLLLEVGAPDELLLEDGTSLLLEADEALSRLQLEGTY